MSCRLRITYEDGVVHTTTLRLSELADVMKESPMFKIRPVLPIFPWLIDFGFEFASHKCNRSSVVRIDVEERIII